MRYRKFAKSRIKVSEIALGSMHFKWTISEEESLKQLDFYADKGGNLIDTSDMYTQWADGLSGGEAEAVIGKWFATRRKREETFLVTKVRTRMWDGPNGEGLGREHILRACDESLKRLQTDYIDLYMSHWPDPSTPIEETTMAYKELVECGKVRFVGLSNYSGAELRKALEVGRDMGVEYVCIEPHYNLLNHKTFEKDILPTVQEYNLAVIPYSPLAGGFLSGSYERGKPPQHGLRAKFAKEKITEKNLDLLDLLGSIGERYRRTTAQISLAWLLHHKWITAPIVGPETQQQLEENLSASDFTLHDADVELINSFISDIG